VSVLGPVIFSETPWRHCQGNGDYLLSGLLPAKGRSDFAELFAPAGPPKTDKNTLYLVALTVPRHQLLERFERRQASFLALLHLHRCRRIMEKFKQMGGIKSEQWARSARNRHHVRRQSPNGLPVMELTEGWHARSTATGDSNDHSQRTRRKSP
jgi:hypothetical protein